MAIEQTQTLPAPVLEAALTAFTKKLPPMMGQPIKTSVYDPKVAGRTRLRWYVLKITQQLCVRLTKAGPRVLYKI